MKKIACFFLALTVLFALALSSFTHKKPAGYISLYEQKIRSFIQEQYSLLSLIEKREPGVAQKDDLIHAKIKATRLKLKELDFWFRYLEPVAYKKINGPLPVEWETEVFEKFEAPYKREGSGLTLATLYLQQEIAGNDSLSILISKSINACQTFLADSIATNLNSYHHFFLANRLFLLNLAAIYTTGYECPYPENIIPELEYMMQSVKTIYAEFNQGFPDHRLTEPYLILYETATEFVNKQPKDAEQFDHFTFIRKFINPLYQLNAEMILNYHVRSTNYNDFALNKQARSIFDRALYRGQNTKGVYIGITDNASLNEIKETGRLLFFDPILSGNNKRSCASCHKPGEYFTDTSVAIHTGFDQQTKLSRHTPSLLNVIHNHLLMQDGKHFNLENQARDVITNPLEMNCSEKDVMEKVLSCSSYKSVFKKYLKATPQYKEVNLEHIASALILYYSDFSTYYSPFDDAMINNTALPQQAITGFNIFMSKGQCATCHFVPQFNGVKPPYIGSEFEVLGVPSDNKLTMLSNDPGRFKINPATETRSAFRTSTVRNSFSTHPYMHNGVFNTLEEVIDFYDGGGGAGRGLHVNNQTLPADSLRLTSPEKKAIIAFIRSLNEDIPVPTAPSSLPLSKNKSLNSRKAGGEY